MDENGVHYKKIAMRILSLSVLTLVLSVLIFTVACNNSSSSTTESKKVGIVGKWTTIESNGEVVLEFTTGGTYIWTNAGKEVSRGTYTFNEKDSSLVMSGRGRTQAKITGDQLEETIQDGITIVYKRL